MYPHTRSVKTLRSRLYSPGGPASHFFEMDSMKYVPAHTTELVVNNPTAVKLNVNPGTPEIFVGVVLPTVPGNDEIEVEAGGTHSRTQHTEEIPAETGIDGTSRSTGKAILKSENSAPGATLAPFGDGDGDGGTRDGGTRDGGTRDVISDPETFDSVMSDDGTEPSGEFCRKLDKKSHRIKKKRKHEGSNYKHRERSKHKRRVKKGKREANPDSSVYRSGLLSSKPNEPLYTITADSPMFDLSEEPHISIHKKVTSAMKKLEVEKQHLPHVPCSKCTRVFYSREDLQKHAIAAHTKFCEICDSRYGQEFEQNHRKIHPEVFSLVCPTCNHRFSHRLGLSSHLRLHLPRTCDVCNMTSPDAASHLEHTKYHKKHVCLVCDMSFPTSQLRLFTDHFHTEHKTLSKEEMSLLRCPFCPKLLASSYALNQHFVNSCTDPTTVADKWDTYRLATQQNVKPEEKKS